MKSKLFFITLIIFGVFLALIVIGTLTKDKDNNPASIGAGGRESQQQNLSLGNPTKGFSLSPISFSSEDFTNFFKTASENGEIITWAGNWVFLKDKTSAPYVVQTLSKQYNYEPIIITNLDENGLEYKQTIINFVEEFKPKYIGIGNEINRENNLDTKAETFNEVYDEIKKVSPNTQVFTIFQLEFLNKDNSWGELEKFKKADFFAFTTYPVILYQTPSEIPENYYSEITQKTSKQIAFTEVGWPRKENQQIEFIKIFNAQTKSLNPKFSIWPFLYDQNVQSPFNTMGLLEKNQETSQELEEWRKI